jgi:hypothetical protein
MVPVCGSNVAFEVVVVFHLELFVDGILVRKLLLGFSCPEVGVRLKLFGNSSDSERPGREDKEVGQNQGHFAMRTGSLDRKGQEAPGDPFSR